MITTNIEELIREVIPIYTYSNPSPVSNKVDCPATRSDKQKRRASMREKLDELIKRYDERATIKAE